MELTRQSDFTRAAQGASREADFTIEEMVYSRTDGRGVIAAFNGVFQRISGYDSSEMLGAPHRLVRHEDMPKGVFHLFWQRLKAGQAVGAYVKNRAKDDSYYWVFATVVPLPDGGYVSLRIKPSSELFAKIPALYAELCALERDHGLTPAASADRLVNLIGQHGYENYAIFQARALYIELTSRARAIGVKYGKRLGWLQALNDATAQVRRERQAVLSVLDELQLLPTNMRLISHRIERGNGPLSTLSERYGVMVDTLLSRIGGIVRSETGHVFPEAEALFQQASARLQRDMFESFGRDHVGPKGVDGAHEASILRDSFRKSCASAGESVQKASQSALHLSREIDQMRRAILALDSIRVMCRVEFGQMAVKSRELAGVIARIDQCHKTLNENLDRLSAAAQMIEDASVSLMATN